MTSAILNENEWEQYTPSNGSEGSLFEEQWCERCLHDRDNDCHIHTSALAGLAPKEWRIPANADEWPGKAECTSFAPYAEKVPF